MPPLSTKKAGISGLEKKAEYPQKARVRHSLEEMPGLNYAHRWRCLYSPEGYYIRGYRPGKISNHVPICISHKFVSNFLQIGLYPKNSLDTLF